MKCYSNANICVLTYNIRHRKTYDTLCLLRALGYKKVTVYAIPLQYKKTFEPLLQHRPDMNWLIDTEKLCDNFDYKYIQIKEYSDVIETEDSIMLICGATLLPDSFIHQYNIINAHPGYIPNCRGLDAYKWAIYEKQPIGVTSHLIGNEVDAGEVMLREKVPIYQYDTFYSVAQRVYEKEIWVLVKSVSHFLNREKNMYISGAGYPLHKRMPKNIENELLKEFDEYKRGVVFDA